MATKAAKTQEKSKPAKMTQAVPDGTKVQFLAYAPGATPGELKPGDIVTVTGYDAREDAYNVQAEDGRQDSILPSEFTETIVETKPKAKAKAKGKAAKTETEPEAEAEEQAPTTPTPTVPVVPISGVLPAFKQTVSVKAILAEFNGKALDAAKTLTDRKEATVFTLGGVLAFIKRNDIHTTILQKSEDGKEMVPVYQPGNRGFNEYVYNMLGIQPRTADYYLSIYEKLSQVTTEAKLAKIGWTRLRELLPLPLTADNVDEWLTSAKEARTAGELNSKITQYLRENTDGTTIHGARNLAQVTVFKLVAPQDMAENWKYAFDKARESIGSEATESACFDHIVTEWLSVYAAEEETSAE